MALPADPNEYDVGDQITLQAIFLANPTLGTIAAQQTTLTLADPTGYANSDPILVAGAGPLGADLVTTIASITGSSAVLAKAASTDVERADVGKPTNATVACTVHQPDATTTTPGASQVSTGQYQASFTAAQSGEHYYRFVASGAAAGAEEGHFVVRPSRVL
jgi:hypothetical protein